MIVKNNVRPLGDRVLISLEEKLDMLNSGIFVPTGTIQPKGKVIAIGESENIKIKVGDYVLLPKLYLEVSVDGVKYYVVKYEHLDVVFEDN